MPIKSVSVSCSADSYEFVPDVVILPGGKLICIYRESDSHGVQQFSRIVTRQSLDNGQTWTDRRVIVESVIDSSGVVLKWNCPRLVRLRNGRLLALCDVLPVPPNEFSDLTNARIVFWWSDDDGNTWSAPVETPIFGIMPDKLVELPSGAWLVATHVRMTGDQYDWAGKLVQIGHRSEDAGQTWQGPTTIGKDERYNLCEGSILPLDDGKLVCYMRENSMLGLPAFKSFSHDEGRTWEGLYPTPMSGCHRPVAGFLPSGKILITYRYQQAGMGNPSGPKTDGAKSYWARNTFAYLETVESARARDLVSQGGIILPIDYDRSPYSDSGYTGWVTLPDGRVFCVNYIADDAPRTQIRGYWFSEDDF